MDSTSIYTKVGDHYGAAARAIDDGKYGQRVASAFGYSKDDLDNAPEESNLGLSCGNPVALANIKEGEIVCDLGSGAGFDVFQAAKKVGPSGKAIGVDMNQDMLKRANEIKTKISASNVTFVDSRIDSINLPDGTVDCVISNCVINLVPEDEKQLVFNETFRILKSGGRVAVSDILSKGDMPEHIKNDMALYVGCIAGASPVANYEKYLKTAGFEDILIVDAKSDLNVYKDTEAGDGQCCGGPALSTKNATNGTEAAAKSSCCGGPPAATAAKVNGDTSEAPATGYDYNEHAGSYKIYAIKP